MTPRPDRRRSSKQIPSLPLFAGPQLGPDASEDFERWDAKFLVNRLGGLYIWPNVILEDAMRPGLSYVVGHYAGFAKVAFVG